MPVARYHEFIPHTSLQGHVKRLWVLEAAYTSDNPTEEVIPDACVELILNFGSPYERAIGSTTRPLPPVCLIGLQTRPLLLHAHGVVKVVAVRFFAHGVLPFFKTEAQPDGTTGLDLDDDWQAAIARCGAKAEAGRYSDAVAEIEDVLIGKRINSLYEPREVQAAANMLYRTKGQFKISELADYCNVSLRQLQRQFDDATGVSPKTLARTIRFEAVRNRLMNEPDTSLIDLAYEAGYSDQAHFINDFKAFAGKTPGEYAADARRFQAMFRDNENVVFLQSPPSMLDYSDGNS